MSYNFYSLPQVYCRNSYPYPQCNWTVCITSPSPTKPIRPNPSPTKLQHLVIAKIAQPLPAVADTLKHVPIHVVFTVASLHRDLIFRFAASGHGESIWNKYEVLIDAYLQRLKVKCVENEAWFRKQSEELNHFRLTFVKTQPSPNSTQLKASLCN